MWSAAIVINRKLLNDAPEVSFVDRDQEIQALSSNRSNYSFAVRIRHRTSNRSLQDLQTKSVQCFIDLGREQYRDRGLNNDGPTDRPQTPETVAGSTLQLDDS